jgi:hypothetical protein
MKSLLFAVAVASQMAIAAAPTAGASGEAKLNCPAGTIAARGKGGQSEAVFCSKVSASGKVVMHGPYVGLHQDGKTSVEGTYVEGKREGNWVSFSEAGSKVEETGFKADDFHGRRAQWTSAGKPIVEENYVNGKRQGTQKYWNGDKVTVVNYVNDVPVAQ